MAQYLRALVDLAEDLGSIPSMHMVHTSILNSSSRVSDCPLLTSLDTKHASDAHTYMQPRYSHIK